MIEDSAEVACSNNPLIFEDGECAPQSSLSVPVPAASASFSSSIINLCNTVLGAGVLALPFAYANAGTVGGPMLVCLSAVLNIFTMHLLSLTARKLGGKGVTFHSLAAQALPASLWWAVDAVVILLMTGLSTSYLIVFGNLTSVAMDTVLTGAMKSLLGSRLAWVTIGLAIVGPLSFLPNLDSLRFTSALAMLFMGYVSALVVVYWQGSSRGPCLDDAEEGSHCGGSVAPFVLKLSSLQAVSLSTFAYTAQTQLLGVANELADYTQPKMDAVICGSVLSCCVLYCVVGHAGYETFGSLVNSDLLESYAAGNPINVARFAISLVVAFSYPLMAQPFKASVASILANQTRFPGLRKLAERRPARLRVLALSSFVAFTYVVALAVRDLGMVLSLLGATASTAIAYLIPTFAYIKAFEHDPDARPKRIAAWCVLIYGAIVMPCCVAATFL